MMPRRKLRGEWNHHEPPLALILANTPCFVWHFRWDPWLIEDWIRLRSRILEEELHWLGSVQAAWRGLLRWGSANLIKSNTWWDFPGGLVEKNLPANAGDRGLIPGSGRSPGGGNGNPLQYSCLENSMDRGAWWATVHGVAKELDTTEWLNGTNNTWWEREEGDDGGWQWRLGWGLGTWQFYTLWLSGFMTKVGQLAKLPDLGFFICKMECLTRIPH